MITKIRYICYIIVDSDTESQKQRFVDDSTIIDASTTATSKSKAIELKRRLDWRSHIAKRVYILTWIRSYDKNIAIADMIAGITLGLTMIPQAIAYAALAGLPSQYGLYSAFVGI